MLLSPGCPMSPLVWITSSNVLSADFILYKFYKGSEKIDFRNSQKVLWFFKFLDLIKMFDSWKKETVLWFCNLKPIR